MKISSPLECQHVAHVDKDLKWTFDRSVAPENIFKIIREIGRGGFGSVYEVLHIPSQTILAGKAVNPEILNKQAGESLLREIEIMKSIVSPFTIQYYGNIIFNNSPMILMEYCDRGSLRDMIDFRNLTLTEEQISIVMRDILIGLEILHDKYSILHRDIKAANILMNSKGGFRVTDFGVSRQFRSKKDMFTVSKIGTPYWMAPEVIDCVKYSFPADIWSVGCTAVELGEGAPPYCELQPSPAMVNISQKGFPGFRDEKRFSKEFKDFVRSCCQKSPADRATIPQLLNHPFIKAAESLNREEVLKPLIDTKIDFQALLDFDDQSTSDEEGVKSWILTAKKTLHINSKKP